VILHQVPLPMDSPVIYMRDWGQRDSFFHSC
jgi:hypothetical protein